MIGIPEDDMNDRARMEASENRGVASQKGNASGLHRVDPARVAETLGSADHAAGYARLEVMLTSIIPRLVGEPSASRDAS